MMWQHKIRCELSVSSPALISSATPSRVWEQAEGWSLLFIQNSKKGKQKHHFFVPQIKMTSLPVRAIQVDVPASDAYSLESVGKHGFCKCLCSRLCDQRFTVEKWFAFFCAAIEAGPQPNGVVRADIYNMVKEAWELTLEWIQLFNSGENRLKSSDPLRAQQPVAAASPGTQDKHVTHLLRHSNRKHVWRRRSGSVQDSETRRLPKRS